MKIYKFAVPYVAYGTDFYEVVANDEREAWKKLRERKFSNIISCDPVEGSMEFDNAFVDSVEEDTND